METTNQDANEIQMEDMDDSHTRGSEEEYDPLFMTQLPRNFEENRHLAALASLLNDEPTESVDEDNEKLSNEPNMTTSPISDLKPSHLALRKMKSSSHRAGGGKVARNRRVRPGSNARYEPYSKGRSSSKSKDRTTRSSSASVGEAQLFLKLWNLNE